MNAIIVPARLASARFPRKLLHPIAGRPLVLRVAERLREQAPDWPLHFAVDGDELAETLEAAGFSAIRTEPDLPSGTDRIARANRRVGATSVVNVQGDEPLVTGGQIRQLAGLLEGGAPMATLAEPFRTAKDFLDPNQVKVVLSDKGEALYFSRAPIPRPREGVEALDDAWVAEARPLRHLGLYAYRADFLETFCRLPTGRLEVIERLEQLRARESGRRIAVGLTEEPSIGIDTPEDARAFEARIEREGRAG